LARERSRAAPAAAGAAGGRCPSCRLRHPGCHRSRPWCPPRTRPPSRPSRRPCRRARPPHLPSAGVRRRSRQDQPTKTGTAAPGIAITEKGAGGGCHWTPPGPIAARPGLARWFGSLMVRSACSAHVVGNLDPTTADGVCREGRRKRPALGATPSRRSMMQIDKNTILELLRQRGQHGPAAGLAEPVGSLDGHVIDGLTWPRVDDGRHESSHRSRV